MVKNDDCNFFFRLWTAGPARAAQSLCLSGFNLPRCGRIISLFRCAALPSTFDLPESLGFILVCAMGSVSV